MANPQQASVLSSLCVRTANLCTSDGEEVIFVLTGTAGYPKREAFVNFGRIMYDTNVSLATTGHLVDDRLVGLRCVSSLPSLLLDWRSFLMRGGRHACYGWWKVASVAGEAEE